MYTYIFVFIFIHETHARTHTHTSPPTSTSGEMCIRICYPGNRANRSSQNKMAQNLETHHNSLESPRSFGWFDFQSEKRKWILTSSAPIDRNLVPRSYLSQKLWLSELSQLPGWQILRRYPNQFCLMLKSRDRNVSSNHPPKTRRGSLKSRSPRRFRQSMMPQA